MLIRQATQADAAALARLGRALEQPWDEIGVSTDIAAYGAGFYVAETEADLVGCIVLRTGHVPEDVDGHSPIQLWRIFVAPEHQGTEIASSLLAQAFAHARVNGHDAIWLGTSEDNARAIAFYRKGGFHPVGTAELHHGHESHRDLIMSRKLP
ncbi:MAG TPA: GNAT family N-acetyltransferase [Xanthomonadaceae bacterium]|uniref:GNAT family N-acetyltransferase n=1 Tax=Lysobacter sp. M2-1 TaxID=2916839 RepID=UPI001F59795F|nr:GNAT family N-acetyltransferase [Xanthomonadaceae bacterium]